MEFPYYSLRDGFNSTLALVSASPKPLDFVLAVRSRSGQTLLAPAMAIQPQEKLPVDLGQFLASQGADVMGDFSDGSVAVYFKGTPTMLAGQLTMTNPARSLLLGSLVVDNSPGAIGAPASLNALWWGLGSGREAFVRVANTSAGTVLADVFLDFQGKRHPSEPLSFAPFETKVFSIADLLGALDADPAQAPEGGISIVSRGPNPALIAQGRITDAATGFSSPLHFPDLSFHKATALHAGGVPFGTPSEGSPFAGAGTFTPHVIVRNLAASPQNVAITLEYPGGSGPAQAPLAPLPVAGYETKDIPLDAALGFLPAPLPHGSIRIQYSGPPGSAIAEVASIEEKGERVVGSHLVNEGNDFAGSGAYGWHLDDQTESILYLTNMGGVECPIGFRVQANGVPSHVAGLSLKPHETRTISVRKLRDAQKADFQGHKIPADATDGSVLWTRLKNVPVMGHLDVITNGQVVTPDYATSCCCPPNFTSLAVAPQYPSMQPGDHLQLTLTLNTQDCNGPHSYPYTGYVSWSSTATAVATVSSSGLVTAVGGGTANIIADLGPWQQTMCCAGSCKPCNQVEAMGGTTVNVKVLDHFNTSVTSTPVSGETNSVVSGQSAQVQVQAMDNFGGVFTGYRGTVHFSSGDTVATLPSNYTYTSGDNGTHTFSVTLKTVSGTSATRDLSVEDTVKGKKATQNVNLWFRVSMAIEFYENCDGFTLGSYANQTACKSNGWPPNSVFIDLPDTTAGDVPCGTAVRVRNQVDGRLVQTSFQERGPSPLGRKYWNDGNVPTGLNSGDASDGLAIQLGQTFVNGGQPGANRFGCPNPIPNNPPSSAFGQANILWRFGQ